MINLLKMKKVLRRHLQYGLVFLLLLLGQLTPQSWMVGISRFLAGLAWRLLPQERRKLLFNLRLVYPHLRDIEGLGKKIFCSMAYNAIDAIRIPRMSPRELERMVEVSGLEHFHRAYGRGRGVVAVTGHIGCWELIPVWFSHQGYRLSVIGRKIYDPRLDRLLNRARTRWGIQVIDRDQGAREALRALHQGQALGILIDQDTRVASVVVEFMGHPAKTPTGAAMLARKTGAAVVPLAIHRLPNGRHRITVLPEIEPSSRADREQQVLDEVQRQTQAIEQLIGLDITQWAWVHLRWLQKPAA